jgi:hypothetical protein
MSALDLVIGIVFILMGVLFAVFAEGLLSVVDLESRLSRSIASVSRLGTGLGLILVAPVSKSPELFRVLGTVTLLGGLAFLLIPYETWVRFVRWWTTEHLTFYRVATVTVLTTLGVFTTFRAFR